MVLNHIAAVVLFSGPLFWIGLWVAIDPAGVAALAESVVRGGRRMAGKSKTEPDHAENSRRLRMRLRAAGVALVLLAIIV